MLGATLETATPFRTPDIHDDPRFRGWWPRGHPDMRSFLGVPIVAQGEVIGAFYLTEKAGTREFSGDDQALIELLAAHAAIAITNARLYEESRELSMLSERTRLALELHDAVSQKLFSLVLAAESAGVLLEREPGAAREQLARVRELAQEALGELRALILELRPPELERDGLCGALRKHVTLLRRQRGPEIDIQLDDDLPRDAARDRELLRVAQEALNNAVRHAAATRVEVRLHEGDGGIVLEVADDGRGFDPDAGAVRATRLGLTSMEERARRLGGTLTIDSAPGRGTTVRLEVAPA
jgi:signal transduction histidine kinase